MDISSISVPIEKAKTATYDARAGRRTAPTNVGPPYIVKLCSLPVNCDESFVDDLFKSRFMLYKKAKVVFDPSLNPLDTGVVRKVAFVELSLSADLNRVLKWQDLHYKGSRRVVIEPADFADFKHCISFNEQNASRLQLIEVPKREIMKREPEQPTVQAPPKPKPNPFGNAKPVDVVARRQEIEKKLIMVNHTTFKTPGTENDAKPRKLRNSRSERREIAKEATTKEPESKPERATKKANEKASEKTPEKAREKTPEKTPVPKNISEKNDAEKEPEHKEPSDVPRYVPSPIGNAYALSQSLAEILSAGQDDSTLPPKKPAVTLKPLKPVVLRKKVVAEEVEPSPAPVVETPEPSREEPKELDFRSAREMKPKYHEREHKPRNRDGKERNGKQARKREANGTAKEEELRGSKDQVVNGNADKNAPPLGPKTEATETDNRAPRRNRERHKERKERLRRRDKSPEKGRGKPLNLEEPNKSFAKEERPDFEKHIDEITQSAENDKKRAPKRTPPITASEPMSFEDTETAAALMQTRRHENRMKRLGNGRRRSERSSAESATATQAGDVKQTDDEAQSGKAPRGSENESNDTEGKSERRPRPSRRRGGRRQAKPAEST